MRNRFLQRSRGEGFTLVELMAVISIIAIVSGIVFASLPGTKSSQDVNQAAYDIAGVLERARTAAMAGNTYAWVGIAEESETAPGVPGGIGQVVLSVVVASDGTNLNPSGTTPAVLPYGGLMQLHQLFKVSKVHLTSLTAADVTTRSTVPGAAYQVADASFANGTTFPYPLSDTPTYTFTQIIQFNPQGDASRIYAAPVPLIEIGLRPTHGTAVDTTSKNVVAVQVAGIGGKVTVYRP